MSDLLLDTQLLALVDDHERQLRSRHPRLAAYLDLMLKPHELWMGGWIVLGTIYPDEDSANQAYRAAVMHKLTEVERIGKP